MAAGSDGTHPADAPAPWVCTGETYWFILPTPAKVPEGAYDLLEAGSFYASPEAGQFRGGMLGSAIVQVVRYTNTPAGPYDELLYIPGTFDTPIGKAHLKVTRMYVSSEASIYNGRKNWNIPKHLARFAFTRVQPDNSKSPLKIEVFPPTPAGSLPFFSAIVTPSAWMPNFPINTRYLPLDTKMVLPPLPGHGTNAYSIVGTDQWISILPTMRGKAEIVWYEPGGDGGQGVPLGEYADGVGFPKIKPWRFGIHIKTLILDFPVGQAVENKKMK